MKQIYPWKLWTNGKIHRCIEGEDFTTSIRNFTVRCRQYAMQYGYMFKSATNKNTKWVDIQFLPK